MAHASVHDDAALTVQADCRLVCDTGCELAEGITWDAARGLLYWTDIPAGRVYRWRPADATLRSFSVPGIVASLGICASGRLLLAQVSRVVFYDPADGSMQLLAQWDLGGEGRRLNDGKVGPDGAFWVGSMRGPAEKGALAALYRVTADGGVARMVEGIEVSNGLAWSPDGAWMYHSDSRGPWIDRRAFDVRTGQLGASRRMACPDERQGRPDGAAVDAEGGYWSCGVSAGVLNRYAPDGRLLARYVLPVPAPTMCCFGDADLRTLYISSLRHGLERDRLLRFPASGGILALRTDVPGVAVHEFKDMS